MRCAMLRAFEHGDPVGAIFGELCLEGLSVAGNVLSTPVYGLWPERCTLRRPGTIGGSGD
jgi:hypothetical protein